MSEEIIRNAFLYTAAIVGVITLIMCLIIFLSGGSITVTFKKK